MPYIVIRNWERFQHYGNRTVPWVKDYTAQLVDDDYLELSFHRRGVLHGLRLAYCSSNGRLKVEQRSDTTRGTFVTAPISRRLGQRVTSSDLEALVHAGFIAISSRPKLEHVYTESSESLALHARSQELEEELEIQEPSEQSRSETTGGREFAQLGEDEEQGWESNGFDVPTLEDRLNLERSDEMKRLSFGVEP